MARRAKSEALPKAKQSTSKSILGAYRRGASLANLKQKFDVKGNAHLVNILLESDIASGKLPALTRKTARFPKKEFTVIVNKRGTIVLPKESVIESIGLQVGKKLTIRKRGKNIVMACDLGFEFNEKIKPCCHNSFVARNMRQS